MGISWEFDLAVIGGGPAGASAAITAAGLGAKVVLFEAGEFPRQKVCGEFVSSESLDVLRDLLQQTKEAQGVLSSSPVIGETRLWFRGRSIHAAVDPPGLSIPRYHLDCLLWHAAAQAGVVTFTNHEIRAIEGDGPFRVVSASGSMQADAAIIAAGRWSRFTSNVAPTLGPKWLGIKAHFREDRPRPSTDLYFFNGGYCGVQAVGENLVNACAMVRSDYATSLPEVFALDQALAKRSRSWQQVTSPTSTAPLIYRTPTPIQGNLILVGDAAAFIDPFVGDGISIALHTGVLAAQQVSVFLKNGSSALATTAANYKRKYEEQFLPSMLAASQIRKLMFWPRPLQMGVFELLRMPGLLPYLIRKTRHVEPKN